MNRCQFVRSTPVSWTAFIRKATAGWRPRGHHERVRESYIWSISYSINVGAEIFLTRYRLRSVERKGEGFPYFHIYIPWYVCWLWCTVNTVVSENHLQIREIQRGEPSNGDVSTLLAWPGRTYALRECKLLFNHTENKNGCRDYGSSCVIFCPSTQFCQQVI